MELIPFQMEHEGEGIDCEMPHSSKVWRGKTLPNVLLTANVSYFSESEIWLGKISVNGIQFAKFAIVFPHQNFELSCGNTTVKKGAHGQILKGFKFFY